MSTSKTQAPMLFGKEMPSRPYLITRAWFANIGPVEVRVVAFCAAVRIEMTSFKSVAFSPLYSNIRGGK